MEGGSLAKMPGLIREARDMQGIRDSTRKSGDATPKAPPAGSGDAETPKKS